MTKFEDNQSPYLTFSEQVGTPSTPASGLALMYRKTDNVWYVLDDGGTETAIDIGTGALNHNFAATVAPTTTDDTPDYQVGSVWVDVTNDNAYICVDNTSTAAVWYQIGRVDGDIDHGSITGLSDDDHPQYIKDAEFTAADTVLLGTGSGTFTELQHNFSATAAPTANDDTPDYAVGSMWIDVTNDVVYICMDATSTAAVWQEVGAGGGGATVQASAPSTPSTGDLWFDTDDTSIDAGLGSGDGFPGTPSTGQRFQRTDLNYEIFFYDGTRWLSETIYRFESPGLSAATTANATMARFVTDQGDGLDLWLMDYSSEPYVITTTDGSNYWTFTINKRTAANANTNITSFTTASDTADNWNEHTAAIDEVLDVSTHVICQFVANKTGTPGDFYSPFVMTFRKIAT